MHIFVQTPKPAHIIQRKLIINTPGDSLEAEADAVAEQVIHARKPAHVLSAGSGIQRKCAACEADEDTGKHTVCGDEEGETIQRKEASGRAGPAPGVIERISRRDNMGEPLAASVREDVQQSFGFDFSRVRIHRDAEAGDISRSIHAQAFTKGRDIYFGQDMYRPDSTSGKRLLVHELTHVVQQGAATILSGGTNVTGRERPFTRPCAQTDAVQRKATVDPNVVWPVNNLAETELGMTDVGETTIQLNGQDINLPDAGLNEPKLTFTPTTTGAGSAGLGGGSGTASSTAGNITIDTLPTNTLTSTEEVLSRGPWTKVVPQQTVAHNFPTLTDCKGMNKTMFRANGLPDDDAVFASNGRHEAQHAEDNKRLFNRHVVPWDQKLTAAKKAGRKFHGDTQEKAEAALYTAMGGSPIRILKQMRLDIIQATTDYHNSPKGGKAAPSNPQSFDGCKESSVDVSSPA